MSTFGGGSANLIEVKTYELGSTLTSAFVYTVPAGRYAEVNKLITQGSGEIFIRYNFAGLSLDQSTGTGTQTIGSGYILNEGDQVRLINASNVYLFIREFKKP